MVSSGNRRSPAGSVAKAPRGPSARPAPAGRSHMGGPWRKPTCGGRTQQSQNQATGCRTSRSASHCAAAPSMLRVLPLRAAGRHVGAHCLAQARRSSSIPDRPPMRRSGSASGWRWGFSQPLATSRSLTRCYNVLFKSWQQGNICLWVWERTLLLSTLMVPRHRSSGSAVQTHGRRQWLLAMNGNHESAWFGLILPSLVSSCCLDPSCAQALIEVGRLLQGHPKP